MQVIPIVWWIVLVCSFKLFFNYRNTLWHHMLLSDAFIIITILRYHELNKCQNKHQQSGICLSRNNSWKTVINVREI